MTVQLDYFEPGKGLKAAYFVKNGIHLTVGPHFSAMNAPQDGFEVSFWADKNGKPDMDKPLNSKTIRSGTENLEEVADVYARRLDMGAKPEEMFLYDPEDVPNLLMDQAGTQRK